MPGDILPLLCPKEKRERKEEPRQEKQTGYLLWGEQTQKPCRRRHICEQELKKEDKVDASLRRHREGHRQP